MEAPIAVKVEAPVEAPKQETKPEVKEDLVTRVSRFKSEEPKVEKPTEEKFNTNDLQSEIDRISDPKLKAHVEGLRKSLLSGENKKFQEIAEMRKELEKQLNEANRWTPERIQQLLNDQNFVQAAQSVMQAQNPPNSGKTDDEWSALSEGEKAKMLELEKEIAYLKQQSMTAQERQQDELLRSRYANYDANQVSKLKQDLINNRIQATNEHLWKVLDYEAAVQRAYDAGKAEIKAQLAEKANNAPYNTESSDVVRGQNFPGKEATLSQIYQHNKTRNVVTQIRT